MTRIPISFGRCSQKYLEAKLGGIADEEWISVSLQSNYGHSLDAIVADILKTRRERPDGMESKKLRNTRG